MFAAGLTNMTRFLRSLTSATSPSTPFRCTRGEPKLWRVDMVDRDGRLVAHGEVRLQTLDAENP
jgi:hypothetical protein